jgi:hypothetical protein
LETPSRGLHPLEPRTPFIPAPSGGVFWRDFYKGVPGEKKEHYHTGTNYVFLTFFCFFFNKIMYTIFTCTIDHFHEGLHAVKKSLEFDYPRLQGGALSQIHGYGHHDFYS